MVGMVGNDDDCDDSDPTYNPDTPEMCNDLDDNCNGFIDDGLPFFDWYVDFDGDGFGDPTTYVQSCDTIAGMVDNGLDCDDTANSTNPNGSELCNGVDDNCNGEVDENFPVFDWYEDSDGDGFGSPLTDLKSCDLIFGIDQDNTDCDDSDPDLNPNTPETCDGTDENCNGQIDDGFLFYDWFADNDGDGFGNPQSVINSCSVLSGYVQNNADCNDSDNTYNPNTPETCDGTDENCNGQIDEGLPFCHGMSMMMETARRSFLCNSNLHHLSGMVQNIPIVMTVTRPIILALQNFAMVWTRTVMVRLMKV